MSTNADVRVSKPRRGPPADAHTEPLLELIPIGRSTLWAEVRWGRFPKPFKLTPRTTVWRASAIRKYLAAAGTDAQDFV